MFFYLTVKKQLMGERIGIYTSCDELKDVSKALTDPNICIFIYIYIYIYIYINTHTYIK